MSDLNIATSLRCDASGCDVRCIARCLPPTLALHYRPSHRLLVDQSDNRSFARFPSTTSKVMTLGWFCSQSVLFGSISDIARCIAHRIDDCDGTVTSHRSMRFGTDIAIATSGTSLLLCVIFEVHFGPPRPPKQSGPCARLPAAQHLTQPPYRIARTDLWQSLLLSRMLLSIVRLLDLTAVSGDCASRRQLISSDVC